MSDYRIIVTTLVTAGRQVVTLCLLKNLSSSKLLMALCKPLSLFSPLTTQTFFFCIVFPGWCRHSSPEITSRTFSQTRRVMQQNLSVSSLWRTSWTPIIPVAVSWCLRETLSSQAQSSDPQYHRNMDWVSMSQIISATAVTVYIFPCFSVPLQPFMIICSNMSNSRQQEHSKFRLKLTFQTKG